MKTLKTLLFLLFITIVACSKNDDNTSSPPAEENRVSISKIEPIIGAKNTLVTITGKGFSSTNILNSVKINGKNCFVNRASATELEIRIPPSAGSGEIIVKVDGFSANSSTFSFIETITVSTLAGDIQGFQDATGINARFSSPTGIAADAAGNIYVADSGNNRIRKITPNGVVTTFAGSNLGFADGTGVNSLFRTPNGVAVDANGNVYVSDASNHKIRKITPAQEVTTIAGSLVGFINDTGINARFNSPTGIAVDATGNVYVSDYNNHKIRKISPTGVVSTLAGSTSGFADGTGTSAQFDNPFYIALDATGNLFVADGNNHKIRKVTQAGVVTTIAGTTNGFENGNGTNAKFNLPVGIAIDAIGNLFIGDLSNHKIRKIDTSSNLVTTLAGSTQGFNNSVGAGAQFSSPNGVCVDANGIVYVADTSNNRIRKIVID